MLELLRGAGGALILVPCRPVLTTVVPQQGPAGSSGPDAYLRVYMYVYIIPECIYVISECMYVYICNTECVYICVYLYNI